MSRYIAALSVLLLLLPGACQRPDSEDERPPNIVFILADDMGWNQLGCYGGPYTTPSIDQLAVKGMRFTQAYAAAAVCSPTRAAILTGKYPARLRITDFIKGQQFPDSLLRQPDWQKHLPLEEVTLAEILKDNGYRTATFGKWHLSKEKRPPESEPFNPDKQGFDESLITYKPNPNQTNPEHDPHNVDSITNRALKFLKKNVNNPFFLYISHNAIHDPVMESRQRTAKYRDNKSIKDYNIQPQLAAMIERLDEGVGKLLGAIDRFGLSDNTIVIFYADNGGKEAYASQRPFKKGKGWLYEGGIRVPLIICYPGKIEAGSQTDEMVSSIDLMPTLLTLADISYPDLAIDGTSFADQLLGAPPDNERVLYWHYPHYHGGSGMKPASALRVGRYKLIEWHEALLTGGQAYELFDLVTDPGEQHNLSETAPETLRKLMEKLGIWKKEVGVQMPVLKE